MADRKEHEMQKVSSIEYVRGLDANGNSIKISKDDLMKLVPGIALAFKGTDLGASDVNITGNHDGLDSGYGWYNNTNSSSDEFAPMSSAGIFFRFKSEITPITFFLITVANSSKVGTLWWRPDGGVCTKVNG